MFADQSFRVQQHKNAANYSIAETGWKVCIGHLHLLCFGVVLSAVVTFYKMWFFLHLKGIFFSSDLWEGKYGLRTNSLWPQYGCAGSFKPCEAWWYYQHRASDDSTCGGLEVLPERLASFIWDTFKFCGMFLIVPHCCHCEVCHPWLDIWMILSKKCVLFDIW